MPRLVYSLLFETEREPAAKIVEFIFNLNHASNSCNIRPVGKPRVVDLRPGDEFVHGPTQKRYKLAALSAYRQHQLSDGLVAAGRVPADGYLVQR
jgi:hypothetical protein